MWNKEKIPCKGLTAVEYDAITDCLQISSKDKRIMQIVMQTNKLLDHKEEVKQMDMLQKLLSGESRCTSSLTSSLTDGRRRSSWGRQSVDASARSSLLGSYMDDGSEATEFSKTRAAILLAVKERLRKMTSAGQRSTSGSAGSSLYGGGIKCDSLSVAGITRRMLGENWPHFATSRCRISRYNGFDNWPRPLVNRLGTGEEHPNRSVGCYACGSPMSSNEQLQRGFADTCLHPTCFEQLMAE